MYKGHSMRLHRRQFILGPDPFVPHDGWLTAPVAGVGYLSHSPDLLVQTVVDAESCEWYLLGFALEANERKPDPIVQISHARTSDVAHLYRSWAGRWLLIGNGTIHMDATGLAGCFYHQPGGRNDDCIWVSSSAALLGELLRIDMTPERTLIHGGGFDWFPPPRSRFPSIRRLIPSQILVLGDGSLMPRLLIPEKPLVDSDDDLLDAIQEYLISAMQRLARTTDSLWLALTSGYDSRLLLATAVASGVPVRTFTNQHSKLTRSDVLLPPLLAKAAGLEHHKPYGTPFSRDLEELYDQHTAGHAVGPDRMYLSHRYYNWTEPGDVILRGGVVPAGAGRYVSKFPSKGGAVPPDANVIVSGMMPGNGRAHPALVCAIEEWVDWVRQAPEEGLDWRERLYIEQRIGGWLSSIEQSLDLINGQTFHLPNSHQYLSYVTQISAIRRIGKRHQAELIRRMAPELSRFPFNPPAPWPTRIVRRAKRALKQALPTAS